MVVPIAGLVVAALAVLIGGGFGLSLWRRRWLMADLPTSDAAHVFVGMNEVVGTAVPLATPIVAPYSAVECVWYRSLLEREESNGNDRSEWETVADERSEAPFWIADDSGRVLVRPLGASVYPRERLRDTHPGRPTRYSGLSLLHSLSGGSLLGGLSNARHRSTEWVIRPDEQIYLLGEATLRSDAVALEFAPSDAITGVQRRPLLVASGDERQTARRTAWQALGLLVLAMAGAALLPAAWHAIRTADETGGESTIEAVGSQMVVAALLVLAVLPVMYVGRLYNRLVAVRNRAQAAWSLIDVHLRKRHDLLPELARVVDAAYAHERSVQESLAALRGGAPPPAARARPAGAPPHPAAAPDRADHERARSLVALAEAYPELRTQENTAALLREIAAAENGVAFARTFYNDAVTVMRDRRQRFPGMLLAPLVPVPSMELFQPDEPDARPAEATVAPPA
jgi:LemA protein